MEIPAQDGRPGLGRGELAGFLRLDFGVICGSLSRGVVILHELLET